MLNLIKDNLKESINLFIEKPWVGLVILFVCSTIFFMDKWVEAKEVCQEEIDKYISLSFDNLLLLQSERIKLEIERKTSDSLYKVKLEEELIKLKNGSN